MIPLEEVIKLADILMKQEELEECIQQEWIKPHKQRSSYYFEEIDINRLKLIDDLKYRLHIEHDTIPLILSLLDQLYATRAKTQQLINAIEKQPRRVQADILSLLKD